MLFRLNKYILFTLTTLLLAAFFVVDINKTNAAFDPAVTYAKPINGQLSADEWNNLKLDFLNTWGNTTAKGGIGIGIAPRPVDFNGLLASSTITTFGGFIGSLNATNISAGNFGTNYSGGGGIWGFPYGKLGVSYSANEMQPGTATFAVNGNVGIGTTTPGALFHVNGTSLFSGSASFDGSVNINTDPDFNSSGFEYGNGFDPSVGEYFNERFRVNSFFESPFLSMGVAQNYLLYTENFEYANWVQTNIAAFSANGILSPTGVKTAEIIPAGTNAAANISQVITNNVQGDWSAGIWVRSQSGPATIKIRIDSSAQTGDEKSINIDERWRFYSVGQNFNAAHTTKTFRIITGTNSVSLWGARMNPGAVVNAYFARTSSALPTATPGVFFNNNVVYASTFSGSLSGNAASATYATYGSYAGFSLSNNVDNANKWLRIGSITLTYNSTYRFGQSWNVEFNIKENTNDPNRAHNELDNAQIVMRGTMRTVTGSADFNTAIPSFSVELNGSNLSLTPDDIAMQVDSSTTVAKVVSLYVRLKDANTNYVFAPVNRYGASYSSSGSVSGSYCTFSIPSQVAYVDLPTSAQDSAVYATAGSGINLWKLNGNSIHSLKSFVGINTTTPQSALDVVGQIKMRESTITQAEDVINKGYLDAIVFPSSTPAVGTQSGFWTAGAANSIYNNNNGNIGIGTTNPAGKLDVSAGLSTQTAGDLVVDTVNKKVYVGTLDSGQGNTQFIFRDRLNNQKMKLFNGNAQSFFMGNFGQNYGLKIQSASLNSLTGAETTKARLEVDSGNTIFPSAVFLTGNVGVGNTNPGSLLSIGATAFDLTAAGTMYSGATTTRYVDLSGVLPSSISVPNDIYSSAGSLKIAGTGNSYVMGKMGIGTSNPGKALSVNGDASIDGLLTVARDTFPVAEFVRGYNGSGTAWVARMQVTGTPASGKGAGFLFTAPSSNGATSAGIFGGGLDNITYGQATGFLQFAPAYNGADPAGRKDMLLTATGPSSGDSVLSILSNVGIGTTTPTAKLEVNGTFKVAGPLNSVVLEKLSGTGSRIVMTDSSGSLYATSSSVATGLPSSSIAGQTLRSDGSGWLANSNIFNNGTRVGIGTTTPTAKLEVDGTFSTNDNARIGSLPLQYPYRRVDSYSHDGTGYYWGFGVNSGGTQKINSFYVGASRVFNTVDGLNVVSWIANEFNGGTPEYSKAISLNASGNSYFNGGNVGIGTTNPTKELEIAGNLKVNTKLSSAIYIGDNTTSPGYNIIAMNGATNDNFQGFGSGNGTTFYMQSMGDLIFRSGGASERMRILSTGNVGIGTTSPSYKLDVSGEASFNSNQIHGVAAPTQLTDAANRGYVDTAFANLASSTNALNYWTANGNSIFNNNTANVGIGTADPSEKLEIVGKLKIGNNTISGENFNFESDSGSGMKIQTANGYLNITPLNTGWVHFYTDRSAVIFNKPIYNIGGGGFSSYSNENLLLKTGGTTRITANYNNGNVGIGTITPAYKLDVSGEASFNDNQVHGISAPTQLTDAANKSYVDTNTFWAGSLTGNAYNINSGNIGIGTMAPNGKLVVKGSVSDLLVLSKSSTTNGDGPELLFHTTTAEYTGDSHVSAKIKGVRMGNGATGDLAFYTRVGDATTEKVRINSLGRLGVGKTAPSYMLDVVGEASFNANQIHGVSAPTQLTDAANRGYVDTAVTNVIASTSALNYWTANGNSIFNNNTANVGIGTTAPTEKFDIVGKLRMGSDTTNATNKFSYLLSRHYTNAEEDFLSYLAGSNSTTNYIRFGGGSGSYNAATQLDFYTATNNTTLTGTSKMTILNDGAVGIGITSPGSLLTVGSNLGFTAGGTIYNSNSTRYLDLSGVKAFSLEVPNAIKFGDTSDACDAAHTGALRYNAISGQSYLCDGTRWLNQKNCGLMTDDAGKSYGTVQIGGQCWMAENIDIGAMIPGASNPSTSDNIIEKYCYGDIPSNCSLYGGLYNWNEAVRGAKVSGARGICPAGWHVPTDAEFNILEKTVLGVIASSNSQFPCDFSVSGWRRCADDSGTDPGGASGVGKSLKGVGLGSGVGLGNDLVGFNAKLSGYRNTDSSFYNLGSYLFLWSSSPSGSSHAWFRYLYSSYSAVFRIASSRAYGFSVRCVRD